MPTSSARLAVEAWMARHHGVVTRQRARWLGLSDTEIDSLLRRGQWEALHRNVYAAAGAPETPHRALLAAVAACGAGAVASHQSAAWLLGWLDWIPLPHRVTTTRSVRRRVAGARVSRSQTAPAVTHSGVPCTPPTRTLIDCAGVVDDATLGRIVDTALASRLVTLPRLLEEVRPVTARGGRRGRARLRAHLARRGYAGAPSPSVLESRMARVLRDAGLPPAVCELPVVADGADYRLDFAYPDRRLVFEVDGYIWHSSPERMQADQRRRNALVRAGWTVLVYTWRDVVSRPDRVGAEARAAYEAAGTVNTRPQPLSTRAHPQAHKPVSADRTSQ